MDLPNTIAVHPGTWTYTVVFLGLWLVITGVLVLLLYRRRHHPYLKARSANIIILCVVGQYIVILSPSLYVALGEVYPCWCTHIGCAIGGVGVVFPDVLRCLRLIVMDRIRRLTVKVYQLEENDGSFYLNNNNSNNNNLNNNNSNNNNLNNNNLNNNNLNNNKNNSNNELKKKYLRKISILKNLIKPRGIIGIYSVLLMIQTIGFCIFVFGFSSTEMTMSRCPGLISTIHASIVMLSYGVALLVCSIFIYNIREEFNIKRGIWITALILLLGLVSVLVWFVVPDNVKYYFPRQFFYHQLVILDLINVALFPLLKSYSSKYRTISLLDTTEGLSGESNEELKSVLENPKLSQLFNEYCQLEFSTENFYFWQDEKHFQSLKNDQDRKNNAQEIIARYLDQSAPMGLNISVSVFRSTLNSWKEQESNEISPELFSVVRQEVFRNLFDTFLRFRNSSIWKEYQQELEAEKNVYGELLVE